MILIDNDGEREANDIKRLAANFKRKRKTKVTEIKTILGFEIKNNKPKPIYKNK